MKTMKRILAFVLCICMVAACWPAEATKAEENVTTSDISTYYLNNEKATVYTSNYFSTEEKYNSALGAFSSNGARLPYANLTATAPDTTDNAVFDGISQAYVNNLQNYTVSADISIISQTSSNFGAVTAYSACTTSNSDKTYGYEFAIMGNKDNAGQTFRLYRRSATDAEVLKMSNGEDCNVLITDYLSNYQPGTDKITLSLSATTNAEGNVVLDCFAAIRGEEPVLIYKESIVDSSDNKIISGAPGFKAQRTGSTFYNVSVTSLDENKTNLYSDDFTSQTQYENALGNYKGYTYQLPWTDEEGIDSVDGTRQYSAIFNGILQNYSVSADLLVGADKTGGYAGVVAYFGSDGKTGYEFAIVGTKDGHKFRLYRRSLNNKGTLAVVDAEGATVDNPHLISTDFTEYSPGVDKVTLTISVSHNADGNVVLDCYAKIGTLTKLIFGNVVDDSADKITSGAPGLKVSGEYVAFSNIAVAIKTADTSYLYKDDFTYAHSFDEALSQESFQYGNNYVLNDGKLSVPSGTKISLFKGINDYATLANYTAEADFVFPTNSGHNAIMVYGSGSGSTSSGYEFGVVSGKFRLYRNVNKAGDGSGTLAGSDDVNKVSAWFDSYTEGEQLEIHLSLTAITNVDNSVTLTCKARYGKVEKTIFTVTDNSDYKFTAGTAGLRGTTGTVDNICVTKVTNSFGLSDLTYADVKAENAFTLHGVTATEDGFVRMDTTVAEEIAGSTDFSKKSVYTHSRETAGGRIRFSTDSSYVAIKAEYPSYVSDYAPLMGDGKIGFDVYVDTAEGSTYYGTISPTKAPSKDANWTYEGIVEFPTEDTRNITVYMPITNEVSEVSIGVDKEATVGANAIAYETEAPIVYYGSSITQGGNATRPGNTYVNTIGRMINRDYLNLGMWGSCHAETTFANYIAGLNMSVFVFDYDHNGDAAELTERHEAFYEIVRAAHSDLPIVFISRPNTVQRDWEECRAVIKQTYDNAVATGDKNVYFIDGQTFFAGEEGCTTDEDKVHPTDKGQALMAEKIGALLENIIEEDYYDVSLYRSEETKTYPSKEGKVFAGWYTDKNFSKESALSKTATTGWAYAKFVDEKVLSVKAQLDGNTKTASDTEKTRMRFVTTVDCLDYDKIGFVVSTPNKTATFESKTVYSTLLAQGLEVPYEPKEISSDSLYFATMILGNLSATEADLKKVFTVTPFWVTADGTTVTGITRDANNDPITIQAGIDTNNKNNSSSSPYSLR